MKYTYIIVLVFNGVLLNEISYYAPSDKKFISGIIEIILIYTSCLMLFVYTLPQWKSFNNLSIYSKNLFKLYWLYSLFIIIYGLIVSITYWDYRHVFINYVPSIIISLIIFAGINYEQCLNLFKFIIKIILPIALLFGILVWLGYSRTLGEFLSIHPIAVIPRMSIPIFLFILAFPFLQIKHRWLILFLSIMILYVNLGWRANVLRIFICWLIILFYYLYLLKPKFLNLIYIPLIFITPLISLYLAGEGTMDIFQLFSESEFELKIGKANTRTFLYQETLWSMKNQGVNFLFGGGASAGYQSNAFGQLDPFGGGYMRYRSEVGFLNTLLKSGIIGVIFSILIIFIPAYFAINQSNNDFCKILGCYVVFLWIFSFLENYQYFNVNYFFIYLIIGLCLSNTFRKLNDDQIKDFFKSI